MIGYTTISGKVVPMKWEIPKYRSSIQVKAGSRQESGDMAGLETEGR